MKRLAVCLLLVLPAGCAFNQAANNGPQAICARQANDDPEVVKLSNQVSTEGGSNPYMDSRIRLAKHRAMQSCLLAHGAAPRGGVEPVLRQ